MFFQQPKHRQGDPNHGWILQRPETASPAASPPSLPDPAEEEKKRRLEALGRRRRGRSGTIATSARGLLELSDNTSRRKSLLGE